MTESEESVELCVRKSKQEEKIFAVKRLFLSYLIQQFKKSHPEHFSHKAFADYYQKLVETDQLQEQFMLFIDEKTEKKVQEKPSFLQKGKTFFTDLFRKKTPADYQKIIADRLYDEYLKNILLKKPISTNAIYSLLEKCNTTEFYIKSPYTAFGDLTPLTFACKINDLSLVHKLQRLNADVNFPDSDLNLPLHLSVRWGRYEIVQSLLMSDEIDKECPDYKTGRTPLQEAAFCGYADIMGLLLMNGVRFEDPEKLAALARKGKIYRMSTDKKEDFEKRNFENVLEMIHYYADQKNEKHQSAEMTEKTETNSMQNKPVKIMSDQNLNQLIRTGLGFNLSREHI